MSTVPSGGRHPTGTGPDAPDRPSVRTVAPVRAAGTAAAVVVLAVLAVSTATVVARHGGGTSLGPVPAAPSTGPEDGPPELAIAAAPGQPSWRPVASGELSADWQDWSWDAVVTRGRSGPDGAAAIRVDLTDGYAGFSLRRDEPVRPGPGATARVRLWVEGEGTVLGLAVQSTDDRPGRRGTDVEVPGRHWVVLDLPVGPAPVRRVTVERRGSGAAAGTVRIWVAAVLVS